MSTDIWVVTGVDDEARGLAHAAAGRAGLPTGAWIERAIGKTPSFPVPPPSDVEDIAPDAEDDTAEAADADMIAALQEIDGRIDGSAERLAARTATLAPILPSYETGDRKARESAGETPAPPHELPASHLHRLIVRGGLLGLAFIAAITVTAMVVTLAVDAISVDGADTGMAGRSQAAIEIDAAVSRDLKIATQMSPAVTSGRDSETSKLVSGLRDAAAAGDARAQHNLGLLYATGNASPENRRRAPIWLHRAAAQGLPEAAYHLGVIYERGELVAKDRQKAVRFYRRAAEANHARAQHNLAVALGTGNGSAADVVQAASWLRAAAAAGIPESQYGLGLLYEQGLGVARDPAAAVALYRKAAQSKHVGAVDSLQRVLAGQTVPAEVVRDALRPLGFDPAAVARVAALAGARPPQSVKPGAVFAAQSERGDDGGYLMLLGPSLGKIEFPAP